MSHNKKHIHFNHKVRKVMGTEIPKFDLKDFWEKYASGYRFINKGNECMKDSKYIIQNM